MKQALRVSSLFTLFALLALPLAAQPTAVVNVASYANPNLPNGNIAQGSMFTVFGTNIGPASLAQVSAFPLPTDLGGTSISVSVGGQTVDCIMIFSAAGQVAAVLPSNTPVGAGTLTLTYNGQAGAPIPITVVEHSFGTFGINQAGSGPGVLTNAANPLSVNNILNSAVPGDSWDIWGTGLGAVAGDEAAMPLPGDLAYDVQVFVGSTPAQVLYRGRSGCCVGIDQIRFVVPAGLTGCYVPITVVVDGTASNFTTMAINGNGGPCSDAATGITGSILSQAEANGGLRLGTVGGSRVRTSFDISSFPPAQEFVTTADSVYGSFEKLTIPQLQSVSGFTNVAVDGGCYVYQFRDSDGQSSTDPVTPTLLDAGAALTLTGPEGTASIPKDSNGLYDKLLNLPISFLKSLVEGKNPGVKGQFPSSEGYFEPGTHSVTGPGGADVGAFTAEFELGDAVAWTNPTNSISRSGPFTVRWEGGSGDQILIFGLSAYDFGEDETGSGAAFWCSASRSAGSFTIPASVLSSLPPTSSVQGVPSGAFGVGTQSIDSFTAPGLDVGISSFTDMEFHFGVDYQ